MTVRTVQYQSRSLPLRPADAVVTTYPDGWQCIMPANLLRPRPEPMGDDETSPVIVTRVPLGWSTQVPLMARLRPEPMADDELSPTTVVAAPVQGWNIEPVVPRRRKNQPTVELELPEQQVPTLFVPNAWVEVWPGPQRKPFKAALQRDNQPVLAAYTTVVVTYPDGWQVSIPPTLKKPRPVDIKVNPEVPLAGAPGGWSALSPYVVRFSEVMGDDILPPYPVAQVSAAFPEGWAGFFDRRTVKPKAVPGETAAGMQLLAAVMGWTEAPAQVPRRLQRRLPDAALVVPPLSFHVPATFTDPVRVRARLKPLSAEVLPVQAQAAPKAVQDTGWHYGPRTRPRPSSAFLLAPRVPQPEATPGNTDLWSHISIHLRRIPVFMPEFYSPFQTRVVFSIISRPNLIGISTAPTLVGVSTDPTLIGTSTDPDLIGEV